MGLFDLFKKKPEEPTLANLKGQLAKLMSAREEIRAQRKTFQQRILEQRLLHAQAQRSGEEHERRLKQLQEKLGPRGPGISVEQYHECVRLIADVQGL